MREGLFLAQNEVRTAVKDMQRPVRKELIVRGDGNAHMKIMKVFKKHFMRRDLTLVGRMNSETQEEKLIVVL